MISRVGRGSRSYEGSKFLIPKLRKTPTHFSYMFDGGSINSLNHYIMFGSINHREIIEEK